MDRTIRQLNSKACIQNRTAARTAERVLSQLAAVTLATGAFLMQFRASVVWRRAADWDNPRSGSFLKTRLKKMAIGATPVLRSFFGLAL
jgi:hypothetical protein